MTAPETPEPMESLASLLARWDAPDRPEGWNDGDEHHLAATLIEALRKPPTYAEVEAAYLAWSDAVNGGLSANREAMRAALEAARAAS